MGEKDHSTQIGTSLLDRRSLLGRDAAIWGRMIVHKNFNRADTWSLATEHAFYSLTFVIWEAMTFQRPSR